MRLSTHIRDCLYLNWALPVDRLPPPPSSLRYELHTADDDDYALATALLFHQQGLHVDVLPLLRFSFPQFHLRLYVTDEDGMPAVLFRKMLVPAWVVPGLRLLGRHPVQSARFDYRTAGSEHSSPAGDPCPSRPDGDGAAWEWRVVGHGSFTCRAAPGPPRVGSGILGSWRETVNYLRLRNRGYFESRGRLHRIDSENHPLEATPVTAVIGDSSLLQECLGVAEWPPLHSAWLCPEMPLAFDLAPDEEIQLPRGAPVPG